MTTSSRLMIKFPGQKNWIGLETLDTKKIKPSTMIEIKDISCRTKNKSWEKSQNLGKIPYSLAKIKYSI